MLRKLRKRQNNKAMTIYMHNYAPVQSIRRSYCDAFTLEFEKKIF